MDLMTVFAGIGAAAAIAGGLSSYFGVKYGLNGMKARVERIERYVENMPERLARLEAHAERRHD